MAIKELEMTWKDETAGKSEIEGLVFPADRHWLQCKVIMDGENRKQKISTDVYTTERKANGSVEGDGIEEYTCDINEMTSIKVTGELVNKGITGAKGKVSVICTYDDSSTILKGEN